MGEALLDGKVSTNLSSRKNGIPQNPNCCWEYETLINFFHAVLPSAIEELKSAISGATGRLSDNGHDGGNGSEEIFSNSKASNNPEVMRGINLEKQGYETKMLYFEKLKQDIQEGKFVCKCSYQKFYVKRVL